MMSNDRDLRWLWMFGALIFSGCDDASTSQKEIPIATAKSLKQKTEPKTDGDASGTKERNFEGAIFQVPTAWEEVPAKSEFIKAEFRVNGSGGAGRLTLSAAGGDVASNILRWRSQFAPSPTDPTPKESKLTVDGKEATLVELFGTFRDGLNGDTQPNAALLGTVIPLSKTNYFVKLTGPQSTIAEARDTFLKFVETAKFNE